MPPQLPNREFALAKSVDKFVEHIQRGYRWRLPKEPKLIRDAVHGYQLLAPYEVAVIDSPLVQRLRGIHQTALAHLVYPTARHSRFDHSLGVAKMVEGMVSALRSSPGGSDIPNESLKRTRLAALLHDTGHLFYSHLGEEIAASVFATELAEAKATGGELFEGKSLGEIISYLMVSSPAFADPMDQILLDAKLHDVSSTRIAPLILGKAEDSQQYEADMISGPFDADKLDYLLRDCHFSGIRTTVDIERVYYTVRLLRAPNQPRSLAMHISGVPNLEQILFAKMILYTSVYHHQKVRALECQFRGLIERILENRDVLHEPELKLYDLYDWLNLTEAKLLVLAGRETALANSVDQLVNRELLKRALVLSVDTVTPESQDGLLEIYADAEDDAVARDLRQSVYDRMGGRTRGHFSDFWIDVPKPPTVIKDVIQVKITADQTSHRPLSTERFQWDRWTNNYGEVKWRSHVFCLDRDKTRKSAAHAAEGLFRERYQIRLNKDARGLAKN